MLNLVKAGDSHISVLYTQLQGWNGSQEIILKENILQS